MSRAVAEAPAKPAPPRTASYTSAPTKYSAQREVEAAVEHDVACANGVVQGTIEPYEGAKRLWTLSTELGELADALRAFAGLASEWEDDPGHRVAYENEIRIAADRFKSRFGKCLTMLFAALGLGCDRFQRLADSAFPDARDAGSPDAAHRPEVGAQLAAPAQAGALAVWAELE